MIFIYNIGEFIGKNLTKIKKGFEWEANGHPY